MQISLMQESHVFCARILTIWVLRRGGEMEPRSRRVRLSRRWCIARPALGTIKTRLRWLSFSTLAWPNSTNKRWFLDSYDRWRTSPVSVPCHPGKFAHSGGRNDETIARIAIAGNQRNSRSLQSDAGADPHNLRAGCAAALPEPSGGILSIEVGTPGWISFPQRERRLPCGNWGNIQATGFLRLRYRKQCVWFHELGS